jgi:HD-GYP domain-containing protein (c-di-GMP phosphodiesterase class II)
MTEPVPIILSGSRFPLLRMAREIALSHDDRWDGAGYEGGRRAEDIPLAGRIVAGADVFDSLTHERPHKPANSMDESVDEIRRGSGSHFDPDVVQAFEVLLGWGVLEHLGEMARASLADGMGLDDLRGPELPES